MAELENRLEREATMGHVRHEPRSEREHRERHAPSGGTFYQTLFVMGLMVSLGMTLMALSWAK